VGFFVDALSVPSSSLVAGEEGDAAAWAAAGLPVRRGRPERQTLDGATVSRGAPSRRAGRTERASGFSHNCRYC
jgi:hypothetical protein